MRGTFLLCDYCNNMMLKTFLKILISINIIIQTSFQDILVKRILDRSKLISFQMKSDQLAKNHHHSKLITIPNFVACVL